MIKKTPYVTTVTPAAKGQSTKTKTSSTSATSTSKPQENKNQGKLQRFDKTFGGSMLWSHLLSKNVADDKDKPSLVTL